MGAALLREQEAGPSDRRGRAGVERCDDVGALGDAAGEQQRELGGQVGARPLQQLQGGRAAADVTARLDSLDDRGVGAGGVGGARLGDAAAQVDPGARAYGAAASPRR